MLSPELRDNVYQHLGLLDYAKAVHSCPHDSPVRATEILERKILEAAVQQYESLHPQHEMDRPEMRRILRGLFLFEMDRSRHLWPPVFDPNVLDPYGLDLEAWYTVVMKRMESCAKRNESHEWRLTCMAAIVGSGMTPQLLSYLPLGFWGDYERLFVEAVTAVGNMDVLNYLLGDPAYAGKSYFIFAVCEGVAFNGSVELFEQINSKFYFDRIDLQFILHSVIKYGRLQLFQHLIPTLVLHLTWPLKSEKINALLFDCCLYGEANLIPVLAPFISRHWGYSRLRNCLLRAATAGNISIFQICSKDDLGDMDILELLKEATKDRHGRVAKYLLCNLGERQAHDLKQNVLRIFTEAVKQQNFKVMDLMLAMNITSGMRITGNEKKIIKAIAKRGHVPVFEYFVAHGSQNPQLDGFNLSVSNNLALQWACKKGHFNLVKFLLSKRPEAAFIGIDAGADNNAPLIHACRSGHQDIVMELLKVDDSGNLVHSTVVPSARDNRPLLVAVGKGHLKIVRFLIQRVSRFDGPPTYLYVGVETALVLALVRAAQRGHLDIVKLLLERNESGDYRHPGIEIPPGLVKQAVSLNQTAIMMELLDHPLPNRDRELSQALDAAVKKQDMPAMLMLYSVLRNGDLENGVVDVDHLISCLLHERRVLPQTILWNAVTFPALESWQQRLTTKGLGYLIFDNTVRLLLFSVYLALGFILGAPWRYLLHLSGF